MEVKFNKYGTGDLSDKLDGYVVNMSRINLRSLGEHELLKRSNAHLKQFSSHPLIFGLSIVCRKQLLSKSIWDDGVYNVVNGILLTCTSGNYPNFHLYYFNSDSQCLESKPYVIVFGDQFNMPVALIFRNDEVLEVCEFNGVSTSLMKNLVFELQNNIDIVIDGFSKPKFEKIVPVFFDNANFGHSLWNDATGFFSLLDYSLLKPFDEILVSPLAPFQKEFFNEKFDSEVNVNYVSSANIQQYYSESLSLPLRFIDFDLNPEEIFKVIHFNNLQSNELRQGSIKIVFNVSNSKWGNCVNEPQAIQSVIEALVEEFDEVDVIFDGYTKLLGEFSPRDKENKEKISVKIKEIIASLTNRKKLRFIILNGLTLNEKLGVYRHLDLYFCRLGSPQTISSWLCDLRGISHASRNLIGKPFVNLYRAGFFGHMSNSTCMTPVEAITDLPGNSYSIDIKWCRDTIIELAKQCLSNRTLI